MRHWEKKLQLSISLEVLHLAFFNHEALKLAPDQYLHHNSECRKCKLCDNNLSCSANKQRSIQIARRGRVFYGCCPHQVWDYAKPVKIGDELAGVLYFTGNQSRLAQIRPAADFTAKFIAIELEEFLKSAQFTRKNRSEEFYLQQSEAYIAGQYLNNIGLNDLAQLLHVNPNYLGALLRRSCGKTFRQKLTEKRLAEAEIYLKLHPNLSISQIAQSCGFSDSNYFSTLFRRRYGFSPRGFRPSGSSAGQGNEKNEK
ncbi:MAG: AraC family transcriptional regulator [Victivallaceae bacterium]